MRFNHLTVPAHWESYWTKYPEGYTILEALINWVGQVDSMVDNVNDWNTYLDNFVETFDTKLQPTVREILSEMEADGRLADIINEEVFNDLNSNLNNREINVKYPPLPFTAAKGDGVTDDTQALYNIIQSLQPTGGRVIVPAGDYLITSQIAIPHRVHVEGVGMAEGSPESTDTRPTRFIKRGGFTAFIVNWASSLKNCSVDGDAGNTGDGVQINGNRGCLENVAVTKHGGHGVIVGDPNIEGNRNYWRLINVTSRENGGHGFVIDDYDPGYGPDANAGYAEQCNAWTNGMNGWTINRSAVSTFIGCYAESNKANGWEIQAAARRHTFFHCGSEQNVGEEYIFKAGSVNNFFCGSPDTSPKDEGNNTILMATGGAMQSLATQRIMLLASEMLNFTSSQTDGAKIRGAIPGLSFYQTGAGTNAKLWELIVASNRMAVRTLDDNGANPQDVLSLYRLSNSKDLDRAVVKAKLIASQGLGLGNMVAATTPGTIIGKAQIFNETGAGIGYIPIYNNLS